MRTLTSEHLAYFKNRISLLTPESKPRWGRLDAKTMMRHLRRALEISLGEVEVSDRSIPILRKIIWLLFFHVFTVWPPSRTRLPAYWLPPADEVFAVERELLISALDRFVKRLEEMPECQAIHTILGPLTPGSWSRAHGVHFHHHFRQFRLLARRSVPRE